MRLAEVPQTDGHPRQGQEACARFRPFDEGDGVLEVALQISPLRVRHAVEAVEVEVRYGHPTFVEVADRVRRARHRPFDAERVRRPADKRRLAGAELAGDGDHVARHELRRQRRGDALGLLGRGRLQLDHAALDARRYESARRASPTPSSTRGRRCAKNRSFSGTVRDSSKTSPNGGSRGFPEDSRNPSHEGVADQGRSEMEISSVS
jgi:hypothetical protein